MGQKKPHYAGPGERLARVAHASGIPLAPEFEPKAIRKAILKKVKTDATISRRVGDPSAEFMTAEELAKMRREARAKARSRAPTT